MSESSLPTPHARRDDNADAAIRSARRRWGICWLALSGALAVHVLDEASTDFLSLWNPMVESIRERVGWIPLPTFDYATWLGGLIAAVGISVGLSWFVFGGARWIRPLSYFLSIIMLANGLGHIAASVWLGQTAPGTASSPLLLAAAACLLWATRRIGAIDAKRHAPHR